MTTAPKVKVQAIMRRGKTERDRKSGKHARHLKNQDTWRTWNNSKQDMRTDYPWDIASGKSRRRMRGEKKHF